MFNETNNIMVTLKYDAKALIKLSQKQNFCHFKRIKKCNYLVIKSLALIKMMYF